jgi:flagellar biosynthetic protein FlhB
MSEETDKESKTEEPTEKKISDAVDKGNTPFSREASLFASLLGILVCLGLLLQGQVAALTNQIARFVDDPGGFALENGTDATLLLWGVSIEAGKFLLPLILVLGVFSLCASLFQNSPAFVLERIRPQWSRISPSKGWKRIFGRPGQVEFLKSVFKFVAISATCIVLLRSDLQALIDAMHSDPTLIPAQVLSLAVRLVSVVCVATIVLVAADLVWSRLRWRSDLRMTRQELKDEMKQAEGDPLVKARLRSLARDRARRRMITAVPRATMVIANPTHYAIALKYDRQEGGAPLVIAKGVDLVALRIREIAAKHDIPIIEDKPLARAMYDAVEVDQWIPPEFYRAVAKILHYLYSRDRHAARRT